MKTGSYWPSSNGSGLTAAELVGGLPRLVATEIVGQDLLLYTVWPLCVYSIPPTVTKTWESFFFWKHPAELFPRRCCRAEEGALRGLAAEWRGEWHWQHLPCKPHEQRAIREALRSGRREPFPLTGRSGKPPRWCGMCVEPWRIIGIWKQDGELKPPISEKNKRFVIKGDSL